MSLPADNPWRDASSGARGDTPRPFSPSLSSPAVPVLTTTLEDGLGEQDPWAALDRPLRPSAPRAPSDQATLDMFDPYPPAHQAEASMPHSVSPVAADDTPAASSLRTPTDDEDLEGGRTPLLSTIGSLFRRTPSGAGTPTPDKGQMRSSGIVQAIVGSGSSSVEQKRTSLDLPPRSPEKVKAASEDGGAAFDFNRFLEQMRDRRADSIAKYLRSFLKEFGKRQWKVQDQIRVINDFLDFISTKMRNNEVWSGMSESDFDNAIDGMEKLVMNRLYDRTFTPALNEAFRLNNPTDDLERDHVLQQRIRLFSWLREEHLDLHAPTEERNRFLDYAQAELRKINRYKAPRDKLITVLNCCKVIYGLIRHASEKEEGADVFVPYLILVVVRANPEHLVSNMQYIQRFRNPERLQGEAGYYLSSLNGAVSFIETMDNSSLSNISQDDFEHHMEQAVADVEDTARHSASFAAQPPTESDVAAAQPVSGGVFDLHPLDALRSAFSDMSLTNRPHQPPQLFAGVPVTTPTTAVDGVVSGEPSPRRRRGYTASVYSRSSESLVQPPTPVSTVPPPVPSEEEINARRMQQANLSTLGSMFPSVDGEILEVVLLSHSGDMNRAIDSLLEMT